MAALARFGVGLAVAASGGLALVAFTPLVTVWFVTVSGLTPELAALAVAPARISVALPALAVLLAFQHGLLVQGRQTRPITISTAVEVAAIAALFLVLGWGLDMTGVTAAMIAMVGGRLAGNLYLRRYVKRAVEAAKSAASADPSRSLSSSRKPSPMLRMIGTALVPTITSPATNQKTRWVKL